MRRYLAEFIAAFFLVFVGAGSIIADQYLISVRQVESFGVLGIALAHGLALGIAIAAIGRISGGHANPAISFAAWVSRRLRGADLGGYVAAQLLGGTLAALLLRGLMPSAAVQDVGVGIPALVDGVSVLEGVALEVVLTFFLAFTIWGVAVDQKGPKAIAPLAIGLVITFDILIGGPFTGAAMNPARWFGPALIAGNFGNFAVWVAGPIIGALLGSLVYENFFLGDQLPEEDTALTAEEDLVPRDEEELDRLLEEEAASRSDEDLFRETPRVDMDKEPEVVEPPTPEPLERPPERPAGPATGDSPPLRPPPAPEPPSPYAPRPETQRPQSPYPPRPESERPSSPYSPRPESDRPRPPEPESERPSPYSPRPESERPPSPYSPRPESERPPSPYSPRPESERPPSPNSPRPESERPPERPSPPTPSDPDEGRDERF